MLDRTDPATDALLRAIQGQYHLEREIGRGGMGVVYLGHDEQLNRPVAIKTLPPHLASDPRVRKRFQTEAQTAGGLSHPNIVPIYAATDRDGVAYFAMRYINGESLADRITRNGTLPSGEVIGLLRQLASALGYAHQKGVVHRDIKAENVLLDSETGRAMLTDFGIARLTEEQNLTATGTVLGTVQYMSPEQVSGDILDGRSDLYSLGILAFLALSGRFPFERPTASAIVVAHVTSTPPRLCSIAKGVPAELGEIVDRLLSKAPSDRYADGQSLRAALDVLPAEASNAPAVSLDSAPMPRALPVRDGGGAVASSFAALPQSNPTQNDASRGHALRSDPSLIDARAGRSDSMSSADANQIWARAAELQAHTGMIVPPSPFELSGGSIASDTVGFNMSTVRDSAIGAGIDARYVERALEERRIASIAHSDSAVTIMESSARVNPFLGGRTKIELETTLEGELNDIGFEEVADEIRRALGEMVTVSAVGRTLTVTTTGNGGRNSAGRQVQIYLTSRNGRTNIRALEDLKHMAVGAFVGGTVGGGMGAGMAAMGSILNATRNGALAVGALAATLGLAFGVSRFFFARSARKREAELRTVLQRVVARAKDTLPMQGELARLPRKN